MQTGAIRLVTAMALSLAPCILTTTSADAQPRRAKLAAKHAEPDEPRLRAGVALFEAREYKRAAAELERVYTATKEPRALYWLGRALQEGGQRAAALRAYTRYMKEASQATLQARGVEVLGMIQALAMEVAVVTVSAPEGATIAVDDVAIGKVPLADALYVDAGKHTISATYGNTTTAKPVDLAEEGRVSLDLNAPEAAAADATSSPARIVKLDAATPSPMPAPATSSEGRDASGVAPLAIGGFGVAGLMAVTSVYFGVKAAGTSSDFSARRTELGASRSELDGLQGDARLQAGLSVGLGIGALGLAGLTLVLLKKQNAQIAEHAARQTSSKVVVTGRGIVFAGSF